jgi:hypothetical protein
MSRGGQHTVRVGRGRGKERLGLDQEMFPSMATGFGPG